MELILKYFPELSEKQTEQFRQLDVLYHDWNAKINVISRKDIDNLYEHHVLHSLGIAEFTRFKSGTGLWIWGREDFRNPPLIIMFPDCHFHLVGSVVKSRFAWSGSELGLGNVTFRRTGQRGQIRFRGKPCRHAVGDLVRLRKNISPVQHNAPQRPYLPEGGRSGERDEPVERTTNGYPVERVLYGNILPPRKWCTFTLKV